jgi:hypothetical protein
MLIEDLYIRIPLHYIVNICLYVCRDPIKFFNNNFKEKKFGEPWCMYVVLSQ